MDSRLILEALPLEAYLPADLKRMLDDTRYFEEHPLYIHLLPKKRSSLTPTAKPFYPSNWKLYGCDAPPDAWIPKRHPATAAKIAALPEAPFDEDPLPLAITLIPSKMTEFLVKVRAENKVQFLRAIFKFVRPSGPRGQGEGTKELSQGFVRIVEISEKMHFVCVTLLVAGFILGTSGESIRGIEAKTKSYIYSYTDDRVEREYRIFLIEGDILPVLMIFSAAIQRYKYLAEGECCGKLVSKVQRVCGVDFFYRPPPRELVPYAAGLHTDDHDWPPKYRCKNDWPKSHYKNGKKGNGKKSGRGQKQRSATRDAPQASTWKAPFADDDPFAFIEGRVIY